MTMIPDLSVPATQTETKTHDLRDRPWPQLSLAAWFAARTAGAIVLLVAVILKAAQIRDPAVRPILAGLHAAGELALALWLIWPFYQRLCWLAAVVCFGAFTLWNLMGIMRGADSCDCLGQIAAKPWLIGGFDAVVFALLMAAWPAVFVKSRPQSHGPVNRTRIAGVGAGGLLVAAFAGMLAVQGAGEFSDGDDDRTAAATDGVASISRIDLASLAVDAERPQEIDLGYLEPRSKHRFGLELDNSSSGPIEVIRVDSECKCARLEGVPAVVGPGASVLASLMFDAWDHPADYAKRIVIQTAGASQPVTHECIIRARIGLPLVLESQTIRIPRGVDDGPPLAVAVRNDGPESIRLLYGMSKPAGCRVTVPSSPIAPGSSAVLLLHLPEPRSAERYTVTIRTTCDHQPTLSLTVYLEEASDS